MQRNAASIMRMSFLLDNPIKFISLLLNQAKIDGVNQWSDYYAYPMSFLIISHLPLVLQSKICCVKGAGVIEYRVKSCNTPNTNRKKLKKSDHFLSY